MLVELLIITVFCVQSGDVGGIVDHHCFLKTHLPINLAKFRLSFFSSTVLGFFSHCISRI
jgi:hypothetical protein